MWNVHKLRAKLLGYKIDPDELEAYRTVVPNTVNMHIELTKDHKLIATVKMIDGKKLDDDFLITEAKNQDELITMINDLVLTYRHVPEIYRPYFRRILMPSDAKNTKESLTLVKG